VGASSNKNAIGQETFLSLLALDRDALLPKRDREGSVGKWIGFELVGEVTVQFLGGAVSFSLHQTILASPFCPCVPVRGKSAGVSTACSAEVRINGNIPPRHIHLHWVNSNYLNFTFTPNKI